MTPDALRTRLDMVEDQVRALRDQAELRDLLDRYHRGFDERRCDDAWLRSIFTEDVSVEFPAGTHTGLPGLGDLSRRIMALWARTLHVTSNHAFGIEGDQASVRATLTATHTHREDDPGAPLHIGADLDGRAVRSPAGWRLRRLAIRLVWTEGDGPAPGFPQLA